MVVVVLVVRPLYKHRTATAHITTTPAAAIGACLVIMVLIVAKECDFVF